MGVETILVAVAEEDQDRTGAIANAVIDIAEPTGATVVIAHVIPEKTYQRAVEQAGEVTDRSETVDDVPAWVKRWSEGEVAGRPGIEGDIPEWVERWSQTGPTEALRDPSRLEALETVLERKDLIQDLAKVLENAEVEYEIRGEVGDPAEHIVAMAEDLDADFVVVGGRNRSRTRQALFGSVSQEILRSVRCPVISVREGVQR
jgi:nucleotide-binding universal stress UspA family protein